MRAAVQNSEPPPTGLPAELEPLGQASAEVLDASQRLADVLSDLTGQVAWLGGGVLVGLALHRVVFALLARMFRRRAGHSTEEERREARIEARVVDRIRQPAALVIAFAALWLAIGYAPLGSEAAAVLRHLAAIAVILGSTWLVVRGVTESVAIFLARFDVSKADNLLARKVHTQFRVITRIVAAVIWILGTATILMSFPSIRQLGTNLLTSAGLAGLIIGLAAQRVIGNFLAGIQLAVTQPIRLDDAVVIAGEWGWIEEITSTYVVVRVWDQRRLIVPFSTLLEQPFQNWTRAEADLIGAVIFYTDYRVPLVALRDELRRVVEGTDLWDGRVCVLQVTDATERTIQLRVLVSAKDSPTAWDLRCLVRERLIDFLQREHPEALPVTRAEVARAAAPTEVPSSRPAPPSGHGIPDVGGLPGAPWDRSDTVPS